MNGQQRNYFTPALIAGAAAGVLSGIPFLNCMCCLWILGGGILAAYLLAKDAASIPNSGDGALVGALTGVVAAVVDALVNIPFRALNVGVMKKLFERLADYGQDMPTGWENWFNRTGPFSIAWFLLGILISGAIFAVLGALGGIIGIALFGKKSPAPPAPQPPPPPQKFYTQP